MKILPIWKCCPSRSQFLWYFFLLTVTNFAQSGHTSLMYPWCSNGAACIKWLIKLPYLQGLKIELYVPFIKESANRREQVETKQGLDLFIQTNYDDCIWKIKLCLVRPQTSVSTSRQILSVINWSFHLVFFLLKLGQLIEVGLERLDVQLAIRIRGRERERKNLVWD